MGGAREETIDHKAEKNEGGRPTRRTTSSEDGTLIASEVAGVPLAKAAPIASPVPDAGLGAATGAATLSPARALLAAVYAAPLGGHGPPPGLGGQTIRTHESGGEFHFHVDDEGLKVAVPVADWWSAWRRLQNLDRFVYPDQKNDTILTVVTYLDDDGAGGDMVKLAINVAPCKVKHSTGFKQMDRTTGR